MAKMANLDRSIDHDLTVWTSFVAPTLQFRQSAPSPTKQKRYHRSAIGAK